MRPLTLIRERLKKRTDSEHEQNLIRLGFGVVVSFYIFYIIPVQAISEHWFDLMIAVLIFWSAAIAIFILILIRPETSPARRIAGIVADIGVLSFIMATLEQYGAVLFALYLWVIVGNGIRYGQFYLYLAMTASLIGFTAVVITSKYWELNSYTATGVFCAMLALPLYFSKLLQRLNVVNQSLEHRVIKRTEELAVARDQALASNVAKDRFLANMSHELRTPLNAIIGYSDLLIEEAQQGKHTDNVDDLQCIQSSSKHLLGIINDMLDLTNINAGKIQIIKESIPMHEFIPEIVDIIQPLLQINHNQFKLIEPLFTGSILADRIKLKQVLLNLLSNACKFTQNGVIQLQVQKSLQDAVECMRFSVSDNGIGIAADKLEPIFESFTQADSSYTRQYGGNGLGLTISRRLCDLMGGNLTVESELQKGSTFRVTIPLNNKV